MNASRKRSKGRRCWHSPVRSGALVEEPAPGAIAWKDEARGQTMKKSREEREGKKYPDLSPPPSY